MIWHWQFDPIALHVGPLQLHWYGVLFALAFVLGQQLLAWCYRREDYDSQALDSPSPYVQTMLRELRGWLADDAILQTMIAGLPAAACRKVAPLRQQTTSLQPTLVPEA